MLCQRGLHDEWRWFNGQQEWRCVPCRRVSNRRNDKRERDDSERIYGVRVDPWNEQNRARHQASDRNSFRKRRLIALGMSPEVFK